MGQLKSTTRNRKNKYLSERERWLIESYKEDKLSGREIARRLGRDPSTVNREIRRGTIKLMGYELVEKVVYAVISEDTAEKQRQVFKDRLRSRT